MLGSNPTNLTMIHYINQIFDDSQIDYLISLIDQSLDLCVTYNNPAEYHLSLIGQWYNRTYSVNEKNISWMRFTDVLIPEISDCINKKVSQSLDGDFINDLYFNVAKYEVGSSIGIHNDGVYTDAQEHTLIILLFDQFTGGDFYINDVMIKLKKGDAILFNRDCMHQVKEISDGTRITLVARMSKRM